MKAMILAAGYGTRLWPLTIDRTKPAIPVLGRPLVGYVAGYLASYGISEVLVNLHHQPDSVREALGDGSRFGVILSYIEEPVILGTSGALDHAKSWFDDGTFVVINGKIVTDIDLSVALEAHRSNGCIATLVLRPNVDHEKFSQVFVENGLLQGFGSPPASDNDSCDIAVIPFMFTGIHILEPEIFRFIPQNCFSHITTDVYLPAIAAGEKIAVHIAEGNWDELSTIKRYLATTIDLLKRQGHNSVLSKGAFIEEGAEVSDAILWENAYIESGAVVREAIIGAEVRVLGQDKLINVAVVRKALVEGEIPPEKALCGYFERENFVVPLG